MNMDKNLWNTHEKIKFHAELPMKLNIINPNETSMKECYENAMKLKKHAMKTL